MRFAEVVGKRHLFFVNFRKFVGVSFSPTYPYFLKTRFLTYT